MNKYKWVAIKIFQNQIANFKIEIDAIFRQINKAITYKKLSQNN